MGEPDRAEADSPPRLLAQARRVADGGQLAEALALCQSVEGRSGPSADLYSLMGVIHQALQERNEAVQNFRKALYLDPDHSEALMHLMLLYQTRGERDQAALLRRRLDRLGAAKTGGET
jgi:chemotaxis protein methyltransferase WspC